MLMMARNARITDEGGVSDSGEIIGGPYIAPDLWFFDCAFPGDPVLPGCLGLEAMWQWACFFLASLGNRSHGRALSVGEAGSVSGKRLDLSDIRAQHRVSPYHEARAARSLPRPLGEGWGEGRIRGEATFHGLGWLGSPHDR